MPVSLYIRLVVAALTLLILQLFVFDLIHISGYGRIMVYPMFILLLPFRFPPILILLIGFLYGILIDLFSGTGGLHAFALTSMAFFRIGIVSFFSLKRKHELEALASFSYVAIQQLLLYTLFMVLMHQLAYYFVERYSLVNFLYTLKRAFSGTFLSVTFIFLLTILFSSRGEKS